MHLILLLPLPEGLGSFTSIPVRPSHFILLGPSQMEIDGLLKLQKTISDSANMTWYQSTVCLSSSFLFNKKFPDGKNCALCMPMSFSVPEHCPAISEDLQTVSNGCSWTLCSCGGSILPGSCSSMAWSSEENQFFLDPSQLRKASGPLLSEQDLLGSSSVFSL